MLVRAGAAVDPADLSDLHGVVSFGTSPAVFAGLGSVQFDGDATGTIDLGINLEGVIYPGPNLYPATVTGAADGRLDLDLGGLPHFGVWDRATGFAAVPGVFVDARPPQLFLLLR